MFSRLSCSWRAPMAAAPISIPVIKASTTARVMISKRQHRSISSPSTGTALKPKFKNIQHLLTLRDLTLPQILLLIRRSLELKRITQSERIKGQANDAGIPNCMSGKTLGILFTKRSTRTRVSAETSWARLGGHPLFLGQDDIQLGAGGESWRDTAVVVSSMVDALLARVGGHEEIELLAKYSTVPVINALTAKYHPLQILADVMTLYEEYVPNALDVPTSETNGLPLPPLPKNLVVAWVGDSNNILNSLLVTLPRLGVSMQVSTPPKYKVDPEILDYAQSQAKQTGGGTFITTSHSPNQAVKDANVIVTDTWISMGQEKEKAQRLKDFDGYKVTEEMAQTAGAKEDWKFMHCLPRKREEVDDEVFYSEKRSLVFPEAENRKHTVMAVFEAFC
ncbi:ornithine carbamoyltransferase [Phlyctochytrium planicorne]|nr:ornithine carbamoyltransferase [Phlyctochytrium planicorne]